MTTAASILAPHDQVVLRSGKIALFAATEQALAARRINYEARPASTFHGTLLANTYVLQLEGTPTAGDVFMGARMFADTVQRLNQTCVWSLQVQEGFTRGYGHYYQFDYLVPQ